MGVQVVGPHGTAQSGCTMAPGLLGLVIDRLVRYGVVHPEELFDSPFTDFDAAGVAGVFPEHAEHVVAVPDGVRRNAIG